MATIRAIVRLTVTAVVIATGTLIILALAWLPIDIRGVRIAAWPITFIVRFLLRLYRVQVHITDAEKLRQHHGFIFPNHTSFLDVFLLTSILPMRFLSKVEVKRWPFIGWVATAVGTVFVNRSDKASREAARQSLTDIPHYPPIVLFPEGGIFPPADKIKPFRYGAFEIVAHGGTPFIPCVMVYDPLEIAFWDDEPLLTAVWRFASFAGTINAELHTLPMVTPASGEDAKELALTTHGIMSTRLTYYQSPNDVLTDGL